MDTRGLRLIAIHLGEAQPQLLLEAAQPPRPTVATAYDRGIDQQLLPREVRQTGLLLALGRRRRRRCEIAELVWLGSHPIDVGLLRRRLPQRQIFGEARSRTSFGG